MTEPTVQIPLSLAFKFFMGSVLDESITDDEAKQFADAITKATIKAALNQAAALTQSQYADTVNPLCRPQND